MSQTPKITRVVGGIKIERSEKEPASISEFDDCIEMTIPQLKRWFITNSLTQAKENFQREFENINPSDMPSDFYKKTEDFIKSVQWVIDDWLEADMYDKKPGRPKNEEANTEAMKVISEYAFKNAKNGILTFPSAEYVHEALTELSYERIRSKGEKIQVLSERQISNILKILRSI
jgi:hypothetical protein